MKRQKDLILLASLAAAGGVAALFLFGPEPIRKLPAGLSARARSQSPWLDEQLQQVSKRVDVLERQLQTTTEDFSHRLEDLRDKTLSQYMPDLGADGNAVRLTSSDLDHDLPRMPRG